MKPKEIGKLLNSKKDSLILIPLCKKHHRMAHDGKISITGFVATIRGLELHFEKKKD